MAAEALLAKNSASRLRCHADHEYVLSTTSGIVTDGYIYELRYLPHRGGEGDADRAGGSRCERRAAVIR
jgi:hypothetical protein